MLINFRIKNVRSFYEEAVLSMQPVEQVSNDDSNLEEFNTFKIPNEDGRLLKSAVIFGANASGKTNLFKAFSYMREAMRFSANEPNSDRDLGIIENNPFFLFQEDAENIPSEYEIEFISKNIYYRYGFHILQKQVEKEWLDKKSHNEDFVNIFYREYKDVQFSNEEDEKGKSIIKLKATELFLSKRESFTLTISADLENVSDWIKNINIISLHDRDSLELFEEQNEKYRLQALEILQKADIGIQDFNLIKRKLHELKDEKPNKEDFKEILDSALSQQALGPFYQKDKVVYSLDLNTQVSVYNKEKKEVGKIEIKLFEDSSMYSDGTKRLFQYLGNILLALDKGGIIIIDEIDSQLHFLVVEYLLQMFNSIDKNPNNAQLICNAHNLMLMDKNLRRDQIYFTSKNKYGESYLDSLADYSEVETKHLLSKQYLAGFFTDLPNLNR